MLADKKKWEINYKANGDCRYYSPERFSAHTLEVNFNGLTSDIWASGLVLLELLTNSIDIEELLKMPNTFFKIFYSFF